MELAIRYKHTFVPGFEGIEERRFMHYSNVEGILLVGEGDFSFSSVLAKAFGFAFNMVATSLDSREKLLTSYQTAWKNLCDLERLGAVILHGVDATAMDKLEEFRDKMFDKIVYNFPHAGFWGCEADKPVIKKHRRLVRMFFKSAKTMLSRTGEIHVTHKEKEPYNKWNLEEQAGKCGLFLKEAVDFHTEDYPGYTNRRGQGANCGGTFHLGPCKTYKFVSSAFFYDSLYLRQVKPKFAKEIGSSCKSRKRKHTSNEEESMLYSLMGIQRPIHFEHGYEAIESGRPVKRSRHEPFEEGYLPMHFEHGCEFHNEAIESSRPVKRGRQEPFEEGYLPIHFEHGHEFHNEAIEYSRPVKRGRHEPFEEGYLPFFSPPASSRLTTEGALFSQGIASGNHFSCFSSLGDPGRREIARHRNEGILQAFRPLENSLPTFRPPASLRLTLENSQFSQGFSLGIASGRHFPHFSYGGPVGRQIAMQRNEGILQTMNGLGFTHH